MLCRDQLHATNLEAVELLARRYQMWESAYAAQLRSAEAGAASGEWLSVRDVFLGIERIANSAIV
eukprot:4441769-Alexandrium_andersonii.AAC.1